MLKSIMDWMNHIEKEEWVSFYLWMSVEKDCLTFIGKSDTTSIYVVIFAKTVTINYKVKRKADITDTHTVMTNHKDAILSLYYKIKWNISTQTKIEIST